MDQKDGARDDLMLRAGELALSAVRQGTGGPFGAVVVRQGAIVGEGQNRVLATNDPTAHAEVEALRAASSALGRFHLEDCVLYASSEPCPMCLAASQWARIGRVWYAASRERAARAGFDDAHFYEELARPPEEREMPVEPWLPEAARAAFEAWDASSDRRLY